MQPRAAGEHQQWTNPSLGGTSSICEGSWRVKKTRHGETLCFVA
jgi:hypothetical protein